MMPFIVLIPLFIAMAGIAVQREGRNAKYLALFASIISLLLLYFVSFGTYTFSWFAVGGYTFSIVASVGPLNIILMAIALLIAPLIMFYSFGYMHVPSEQRRYYLQMLAFESAMVVFAFSGSLITMLIAWEFLSITSYLLVGFWYFKPKTAKAARKAITTVLIGDLAILAAIAILYNASGSLVITAILTASHNAAEYYIAAILLIIAIFTKSAQFPFSEWLPDAMEGPTPVSAYLHSSTMVKAGVFAAIIFLPLFLDTGTTYIIMAFSAVTVVLSTLNALKETQIKRVIAYSTVQELSLMLFAVSGGAVVAGIYFFIAQSFYKALLFFGAGAVMEATEQEELDKVSGLRANSIAFVTTLFGVLSLAGFIPFDGFFAGTGISSSFSSNIIAYVFLSAISILTSMYIFRWFFLTDKKSGDPAMRVSYRRLPKSMLMPMVILATLTLLVSFVFFLLPGFLNFALQPNLGALLTQIPSIKLADAELETALILIGAFVSYAVYRSKRKISSVTLINALHNGTLINALYVGFARLVNGLGDGATLFDIYVSDFFDDIGVAVKRSGYLLRRASSGNINYYAMLFSIGLAAVFIAAYVLYVT